MTKPTKEQDLLVNLVTKYDKVRTEVAQLEKEKDELNAEIKALIGEREAVPVPGWKVTYKYDKDKEVTSFDEQKFADNDTKGYLKYQKMLGEIEVITKKYTKTKTVPGARKLIVESGEEE